MTDTRSPQQEAAYAHNYGVSRSDLSPAAQLAYDQLEADQGHPGAPPKPSTEPAPAQHDGLAIAAFISVWFLAPIGIVLGAVHIAQAHRDGKKASGLAVAAVVIGIVAILAGIIVVIAIASAQPDATQQYINCVDNAIANGTSVAACG